MVDAALSLISPDAGVLANLVTPDIDTSLKYCATIWITVDRIAGSSMDPVWMPAKQRGNGALEIESENLTSKLTHQNPNSNASFLRSLSVETDISQRRLDMAAALASSFGMVNNL